MWFFYFCSLIPIGIGAFLLYKDEQINWIEWAIGSAVALITACIFHAFAMWGMTGDIQTLSGEITKVSHYPRWVERYEEEHSETVDDGNGKSHTRHWTTTEYDTHYEHWTATRNFGKIIDEPNIDESIFNEISSKFGGHLVDDGTQSTDHFGGTRSSGDDSIYSVFNQTGYVYPVTTTKSFQNKIKAAPTVFSFSKVPTNVQIYPWPDNPDWMHSERLLGTASVLIDQYKWDCMNSSLGPRKRVNVILIGFANKPEEYGHYQQAAWIGGKKNDLVICFGNGTKSKPAEWCYVFGWTESELVKKDLQSLLLENPINDNLIGAISMEISKNYQIKDWHKFDYITIQPPTWSYVTYFIVMILSQVGLYVFFHKNEYSKNYRRSSWNNIRLTNRGYMRY